MTMAWVFVGLLGLIAVGLFYQLSGLGKQLEQNKELLSRSRERMEAVEREMEQKNNQLKEIQKNQSDGKGQQKDLRNKLREARDENDKLKERLKQLMDESPEAETELVALRERFQSLQIDLANLQKERESLDVDTQKKIDEIRSKYNAEKKSLQDDLKKITEEKQSLERAQRKLEQQLEKEKKRIGSEKSELRRLRIRADNNDYAYRITQNQLERAFRDNRELQKLLQQEREQILTITQRAEERFGTEPVRAIIDAVLAQAKAEAEKAADAIQPTRDEDAPEFDPGALPQDDDIEMGAASSASVNPTPTA